MSGSEFESRTDVNDLSENERLRRQEESLRRQANTAWLVGRRFDITSEEFESLLELGEEPVGDVLATDLRNLLGNNRDVKDPGSIDADFVNRLGVDVCLRPDLIDLVIRVAKLNSRGEKISTEEMIGAWEHIEEKYNESVDTAEGVKILFAHGANQQEVLELAQTDPKKIRSYARLLDAPLLAGYSRRLAQRALEKDEILPLQTIIAGAMNLVRQHSRRQAGLDAGDPDAIQENESILRSSKFADAASEVAQRNEHSIEMTELPPMDEV